MSKARLLVFDIETYRTREPNIVKRVSDEAMLKEPASNTKKELKLTWDTAQARRERAETALAKTSVNVLLAEVLCVCWDADGATGHVDGMRHAGILDDDLDESECYALGRLAEMWSDIAGPETVWIGHNVLGFDLPILLNRWRRFHITPPENFPQYINGRWRGRVFDTMLRAPSGNGLGMVSAAEVCEAYGLGEMKSYQWDGAPMEGSRIADAFESGAYDAILEYCALDVQHEKILYLLMTGGDCWGTFDRHAEVAEAIAEIRASALTEGQKAMTILDRLEKAGLVPAA